MKQAKHTPGPWRLEHLSWLPTGHVAISADKHGELAHVVWKMEDDDTSPQCEANAHLVAASPDLLSVARSTAAIGLHTLARGEKCSCTLCELVREAQLAVAKAQGEV